jgi:retron-type reverse transcriptase
VDTDIKGFFGRIDHKWLMEFIEHRIADVNIYRLIVRFLKAGVLERGEYSNTEVRAPQGGLISPTLGDIYLHYVLNYYAFLHLSGRVFLLVFNIMMLAL